MLLILLKKKQFLFIYNIYNPVLMYNKLNIGKTKFVWVILKENTELVTIGHLPEILYVRSSNAR